MPEVERPARIKAWIRAVTKPQWFGEAGTWFRRALQAVAVFGQRRLKLGEKLESTYHATWARIEGEVVGREQAEALERWQDAETKRIDAKLKADTYDEKLAQERSRTIQLKTNIAKQRAEIRRTQAEADKLRAEALSIRVDAAIKLVDRLADAKVWLIPDGAGGYKLVPMTQEPDRDALYAELIPQELLKLEGSDESEEDA